MAANLRDDPELGPFVLSNVRLTGIRIGSGAYGSVEEVVIPGAICAAKKIHDFFQDTAQVSDAAIYQYCDHTIYKRMSTDEHPPPSAHRPVPGCVFLSWLTTACACYGATDD